jgi:hypothetical protein
MPDSCRSKWAGVLRIGVYALAWMPPFATFLFFVPLYMPMLRRLDEKGAVSPVVQWLMAFVEFDQTFHHLPAFLGFAAAIAVTNFVLVEKLRAKMGQVAWTTAVILTGIVAAILLCVIVSVPLWSSMRHVGR